MDCYLPAIMMVILWQLTIPECSRAYQSQLSTSKSSGSSNNIFGDEDLVSAHIYLDSSIGNISHFWKSTGFCPPAPHTNAWRWFGSESMVQNILYIGALPFGAIEQLRMHWLLDLITVTSVHADGPVYNMTKLDKLLDRVRRAGLRPGFELMGNPGGVFTNLEDFAQVRWWKDLVHTVAMHYTERYGLAYVSTWNFETWNEPKVGHFDKLNITIKGFCNYYDACAAGLRLAGGGLRLGGPGGECKKYRADHYCWALLNHVANGRDFFTGRPPYTPDFISIHKKGEVPDNTAWVLRREEDTISDIHSHFPSLSHVPIFNDEGDPLVGWSKPKWWRADATYAAMVAKIVTEHHRKWFGKQSKVKFGLLSNDNGFLSYAPEVFTQRTLLARFQVNDTAPPSVEMVTKPAYTVLGLLAYLGDSQLTVLVKDDAIRYKHTDLGAVLGILATHRGADKTDPHQSDEWSTLVYNSNDTNNSSNTVNVQLSFSGTQPYARITVYQIDNSCGNPYSKWAHFGHPSVPSKRQLARMRKEEVLPRVYGPVLFTEDNRVSLKLPQPSIALVQLCARPDEPPQQVTSVSVHPISNEEALVTWDASAITTRCLLTYQVQFSLSGQDGTYSHLNHHDTVFNYVITAGVRGSLRGFYRVRAVDVWHRKALPSTPTYFK